MKREVFEQAAIEANAGLDEIDAEIQQLEARKQSLLVNRELLHTVGRQMLSVLSVISGAVPAKSGAAPDAESIIAWARQRIGGFKVPKSVDFVTALPRNATGKVLRRALREPDWADHERRVA